MILQLTCEGTGVGSLRTNTYYLRAGSDDFVLDCEASGGPDGVDPTYAWTPSGDTEDTSLLSDPNIRNPEFQVSTIDAEYLEELQEQEEDFLGFLTFLYTLTASATDGQVSLTAAFLVRVTVDHPETLGVLCAPSTVDEGEPDFNIPCYETPGNPESTFEWAAHGDTEDTLLLSNKDILSPLFYGAE